MKKISVALLIVAMCLSCGSVAMAALNCEVKTTSEAITATENACEKFGSITFIFDGNTELRDGDWWYADVPYGVQICNDINFAFGDSAGQFPGAGGISGEWRSNDQDEKGFLKLKDVDTTNDEDAALTVKPTVTGGTASSMWFRVTAGPSSSTQRLLIEVFDSDDETDYRSTLNANGSSRLTLNAEAKLEIKLMDGKFYPTGAKDVDTDVIQGKYVYGEDAPLDAIGPVDNTFCGKTYDWHQASPTTRQVVDLSINSGGKSGANFINFNPADPEIAHIAAPNVITPELCKAEPGVINMTDIAQGGCWFDYETSHGYCDDEDIKGDYKFYLASNVPFSAEGTYTVRLELLLNGSNAPHLGGLGIFWKLNNNVDIRLGAYTSRDMLCNKGVGEAPVPLQPKDDRIPLYGTGNCSELSKVNDIAVKNILAANIGFTGKENLLWIDFPNISFNTQLIKPGDIVSVRVTLSRGGEACGGIVAGPFTIDVGTFGNCDASVNLVYPYVDSLNSGWWSGFAVNNMSSLDGEAKIYIFENDGTQASITIPVDANRMFVKTTQDFYSMTGWQITPAGHILGDERGYMIVCADFEADGFAMIGNQTTGEAQGYVPRQRNELVICDK